MEIEFSGTYEKADYFQAIRLVSKPSQLYTVIRIILIAIIVISVAYFLYTAVVEGIGNFELTRAGRIVISLAIAGYFVFRPYISAYQLSARIWQNPAAREPARGYVSSAGITFHKTNGEVVRTWDQYARIRTNAQLAAMLTADGELTILPRRFFQAENDWRAANQWIEARTSDAV